MATQIQLGNFFNANGKTVLGGVGGSGLDTSTLVKSLADAKALPASKKQDQIDLNDKKSAALTEFQKLLSKVKDSANFLRSPPGVANSAEDVFKFTTASVSSATGNPGGSYMNVISSPGASLQSYTINEITSLAKAQKQRTDSFTITDANTSVVANAPVLPDPPIPDMFQAGSFTLKGQSITLAAGDSLNTVAAKFNAVSSATGISATVIKVANNQYQLSFVATKTGIDTIFDFNNVDDNSLVDTDDVFSQLNIVTTEEAANASFKLNNITVERQSNSMADVVEGLAFELVQTTNASLTVNIKPDDAIIKSGVINFVNAYNDLKLFAAKQTELNSTGTFVETAVLSDNPTFRIAMSSVNTQLTAIVSGLTGGNPSQLADLGITFVDLPESKDNPLVRNILNVDDGKLSSSIASNPDGVRRLFGFDLVSDNPALRNFSRSNALSATDFTLDIDPSTNKFKASYMVNGSPVEVDMEVSPLTGMDGFTLTGPSNSALAGMVLIYASADASVIDVKATQGLADRLFNAMDETLKTDTGSLARELQSLKDSGSKLTTEIQKINEQVDLYRQQLLNKFAALEQAISKVNTLLQSIDAQNQARYNS